MWDKKLMFSNAQAETTAAAHDSDTVIDLGASVDYGERGTMWVHALVTTAFTSAGSATLAVAIHDSADDSSFAAVANAPTVAATAVASLVVGYELMRFKLPVDVRRYVKLVYTIGTTTMTAGAITSGLTFGTQTP
ncbi:MAG: hypothetical protein GY710_06125 [Desulfobacteraceae bacterium]|nr:hypothetical protein [Desulfobacteraceae bacterium]